MTPMSKYYKDGEKRYMHYCKETLSYNPKKLPNWVDSKNNDVDGEKYERLIIDGRIIKIIK